MRKSLTLRSRALLVNPLLPGARLIHTVEVIGSNPIAPTIFSSTCRHFRFGSGAIWGHFSNLLDDASLGFALRRGHSLNVRVHGHTDVCVAHQCLHSRHIFTV